MPGIGPWTQAYVNMRALRDRDAWLGTDLVVRKALGVGPLDPEAWRPYRAYAVVHLWNTTALERGRAAHRGARHVRGEREAGEHQQPAQRGGPRRGRR